jgi:hypothetical protein
MVGMATKYPAGSGHVNNCRSNLPVRGRELALDDIPFRESARQRLNGSAGSSPDRPLAGGSGLFLQRP